MRETLEHHISQRLKPAEYFTSEILKPTCISMVLMLLQQLSGISTVVFYCVDIYSSAGTTINPKLGAIILSLVFLLGNIACLLCIDKIGRRFLLLASSVCISLSLLALGYFFFVKQHKDPIVDFILWLPLIALIVYSVGFNLGYGPLPWLIMAELVPIHCKGITATICTSFNWLIGFIIIKSFDDINLIFGVYGMYWLFASISVFGGLFMYLFVPETKGKRLDEIQLYFKVNSNVNEMI